MNKQLMNQPLDRVFQLLDDRLVRAESSPVHLVSYAVAQP